MKNSHTNDAICDTKNNIVTIINKIKKFNNATAIEYVKKYIYIIFIGNFIYSIVLGSILSILYVDYVEHVLINVDDKNVSDIVARCKDVKCDYVYKNDELIDINTGETSYITNHSMLVKNYNLYYGLCMEEVIYYINITNIVYIVVMNTMLIFLFLSIFLYKLFSLIMDEERYKSTARAKSNETIHRYNMLTELMTNLRHEVATPLYVLKSIINDLSTEADELDTNTCPMNNTNNTSCKKCYDIPNNIDNFIMLLRENVEIGNNAIKQLYDIHNEYKTDINNIKKEFSIHDMVVTTLKMLSKSRDTFITDYHIDEDLKKYYLIRDSDINGSFLINIFNNLFLNSYEANANKLNISINKFENSYLTILITDNGNGVTEKDKSSIFNKDYTTKESTNCVLRGNGLYISKLLLNNLYDDDLFLLPNTTPTGATFGLLLKTYIKDV